MAVVILGSINMDLVVQTHRFPQPGETLIGKTFYTAPGGKGANQAVASARLGVKTKMIGRVGNDVFGQSLLENLKNDRIDIVSVTVDQESPSGTALITIDDSAENNIIIIPGANGAVGQAELNALKQSLTAHSLLLLQLEIPMETVIQACHIARERGARIILDPAPAQPLSPELLRLVDILTPNEGETAALVGFQVQSTDNIQQAAKILLNQGVKQVIIKLGAKGAYWTDGKQEKFLKPLPIKAVDTVAAGDAFNGGLAAGLSEGLTISEALTWGMAAGAISATRKGAQPSMPERDDLLAIIQKND